jgi:hypothetical protein
VQFINKQSLNCSVKFSMRSDARHLLNTKLSKTVNNIHSKVEN